jgi:hypothetical protein
MINCAGNKNLIWFQSKGVHLLKGARGVKNESEEVERR